GGDDGDTPREASVRERREEAVMTPNELLPLRVVGMISVEHFRERDSWDPVVREIPEYAFAVRAEGSEIALSSEHMDVAWLTFEQAFACLRWESNCIALRELHHRLSATSDASSPRR